MALPKLTNAKHNTKIPSTGEKVTFRPYLVKEEKILMMALESEEVDQMIQAVKDILEACIDTETKIGNLAMFDIEYLFVQLRSKSVGEKTKIQLTCEHCDHKNPMEIDLDQINVKGLPTSPKDYVIKLTDTIGIKLKYPSIDMIVALQKSEKTDVEKTYATIQDCIDVIYSGDETFDTREQPQSEMDEFMESFNAKQFKMVKDFIEQQPETHLNLSYNCIQCKKKNDLELKGLSNFFG